MRYKILLFSTTLFLQLWTPTIAQAITNLASVNINPGILAPAAPFPKKYALLLTDWTDPIMAKDTRNLVTRLQADGTWKIINLNENFPLRGNERDLSDIITNALSSVMPGDTVWINITTHGGQPDFPDSGATYPYNNRTALLQHWFNVNMNRNEASTKSDLYLYSLGSIIYELRLKGVEVALIDHSCAGGSTSRWTDIISSLWPQQLGNFCTISKAGITSPGRTSDYMAEYLESITDSNHHFRKKSMSDYANWVSSRYYNNHHLKGDRIQTIGYQSGCTASLPLRDTFSLIGSAYTTWWKWMRERPSHVLRAPERYALNNDGDLTNLEPVRGDDPTPENWMRWFRENNLRTYTENAFAPWLQNESSTASQSEVEQSYQTSIDMFIGGIILHALIEEYRDRIFALDDSLTNVLHAFVGFDRIQLGHPLVYTAQPRFELQYRSDPVHMSADEYLRKTFIKNCLCQTGKSGSVDCTKPSPPLALPFARDPMWFICKDPVGFRDFVLEEVGGGISSALNEMNTAEKNVINFSIQYTKTIQSWEQGCISDMCSAISF